MSCQFVPCYIELAYHEGESMTEAQRVSLAAFDALLMDTDNGLFFTLEPSEGW